MTDNQSCGKILALNETQEDRILEALANFRQDIMEEMKSLRQMMKEAFDKSLISLQCKDYAHCDETDLHSSGRDEEDIIVPSLQETFNNITGMLASCDHSWSLSSKQKEFLSSENNANILTTSSDYVKEGVDHCSDDNGNSDDICKDSEDALSRDVRLPVLSSGRKLLNSPSQSVWSPPPNRPKTISSKEQHSKLSACKQSFPEKVSLISKTRTRKSKAEAGWQLRLNEPVLPPLSGFTIKEPVHAAQSLDIFKSSSKKMMSYTCKTCGKSFTRRSNLNDHIRTHTGYKPFKCTVCDKCFITHTSLKNHTRTHTGEKPYRCSDCGKTFAVWSNFRVHARIHTGERPYSCELCDKSFTYLNSYKRHMRRLHAEPAPT